MKPTQPKLIPTLICLAIVGLFAALIPYPGFETITVIPPNTPKNVADKDVNSAYTN
jgi:hypothetical protein